MAHIVVKVPAQIVHVRQGLTWTTLTFDELRRINGEVARQVAAFDPTPPQSPDPTGGTPAAAAVADLARRIA